MPNAAHMPCRRPGCGALVQGGGFCDKHKGEERNYDTRRGSSSKRGYGYKWQKARSAYLEENRFCRPCGEQRRLTRAVAVDHIVPVSGPNDPRFWDRANWQPICQSCHSQKTAQQDGGFGNTSVR